MKTLSNPKCNPFLVTFVVVVCSHKFITDTSTPM